jgi:branched-chain amino acid aminotransferase
METEPNQNIVVFFKNRFVPLREANVNILTHALHYGTAVFEGIRGYWSAEQEQLFLLRPLEHYQRWAANCGILRIGPPFHALALCEITVDLVRRNRFRTDLYVRPLAFKSASRIGVAPDDQDSSADTRRAPWQRTPRPCDRRRVGGLDVVDPQGACGRQVIAHIERARLPRSRAREYGRA